MGDEQRLLLHLELALQHGGDQVGQHGRQAAASQACQGLLIVGTQWLAATGQRQVIGAMATPDGSRSQATCTGKRSKASTCPTASSQRRCG